jgi:hypothetical protein
MNEDYRILGLLFTLAGVLALVIAIAVATGRWAL